MAAASSAPPPMRLCKNRTTHAWVMRRQRAPDAQASPPRGAVAGAVPPASEPPCGTLPQPSIPTPPDGQAPRPPPRIPYAHRPSALKTATAAATAVSDGEAPSVLVASRQYGRFLVKQGSAVEADVRQRGGRVVGVTEPAMASAAPTPSGTDSPAAPGGRRVGGGRHDAAPPRPPRRRLAQDPAADGGAVADSLRDLDKFDATLGNWDHGWLDALPEPLLPSPPHIGLIASPLTTTATGPAKASRGRSFLNATPPPLPAAYTQSPNPFNAALSAERKERERVRERDGVSTAAPRFALSAPPGSEGGGGGGLMLNHPSLRSPVVTLLNRTPAVPLRETYAPGLLLGLTTADLLRCWTGALGGDFHGKVTLEDLARFFDTLVPHYSLQRVEVAKIFVAIANRRPDGTYLHLGTPPGAPLEEGGGGHGGDASGGDAASPRSHRSSSPRGGGGGKARGTPLKRTSMMMQRAAARHASRQGSASQRSAPPVSPRPAGGQPGHLLASPADPATGGGGGGASMATPGGGSSSSAHLPAPGGSPFDGPPQATLFTHDAQHVSFLKVFAALGSLMAGDSAREGMRYLFLRLIELGQIEVSGYLPSARLTAKHVYVAFRKHIPLALYHRWLHLTDALMAHFDEHPPAQPLCSELMNFERFQAYVLLSPSIGRCFEGIVPRADAPGKKVVDVASPVAGAGDNAGGDGKGVRFPQIVTPRTQRRESSK